MVSAAVLGAGGVVVLAEEFSHEIYRKSLARLFELDENGHLQMYFNATLDVVASKVSSRQYHCVVLQHLFHSIYFNKHHRAMAL